MTKKKKRPADLTVDQASKIVDQTKAFLLKHGATEFVLCVHHKGDGFVNQSHCRGDMVIAVRDSLSRKIKKALGTDMTGVGVNIDDLLASMMKAPGAPKKPTLLERLGLKKKAAVS